MKITIESTTKLVTLNGVDARLWEGETDSGIKVHCFIVRIAHDIDAPPERVEQFTRELHAQRPPAPELIPYPTRMIL
jgi:hypothetical protein